VDIGTVIAYKQSERPWGHSEQGEETMASKKATKKLKKGKKLQSKKTLTRRADVGGGGL
jgi:hypothetical protein